jgi:hypothetical protein
VAKPDLPAVAVQVTEKSLVKNGGKIVSTRRPDPIGRRLLGPTFENGHHRTRLVAARPWTDYRHGSSGLESTKKPFMYEVFSCRVLQMSNF